MSRLRPPKRPRALALVFILLLVAVCSMVAASLTLRSQRSAQAGTALQRARAAEDAAFSGLQVGLGAIATQGDSWLGQSTLQPLPRRSDLGYQCTVNSNLSGSSAKVDPDGTTIPPESVYLKSFGSADGTVLAGYAALVAERRGVTYDYPLFSDAKLSLENSLVQALDQAGNLVEKEASIRTNGTFSGSVNLAAGSFVDGSVTVGEGGDPAMVIQASGGSGFSGEPEVGGSNLSLPQAIASYPDSSLQPTRFDIPLPIPIPLVGIFFHNVCVITVPPGIYEHIDLSPGLILEPSLSEWTSVMWEPGQVYCRRLTTGGSNVTMMTSGTVLVHVRDQLQFGAGITGVSSDPGELQFYLTEATSQASLQSTYGTLVLASQGDVQVSDSELKGAIYGRNVSLRNSKLEYPTALDGKVLNESMRGDWRLFGLRSLNPKELEKAP